MFASRNCKTCLFCRMGCFKKLFFRFLVKKIDFEEKARLVVDHNGCSVFIWNSRFGNFSHFVQYPLTTFNLYLYKLGVTLRSLLYE